MAQNQSEFKFSADKPKTNGRVFTVSEVNSLIKVILLNNFPSRLAVTGEVTDFRCHQNGHCYFTLKDAMAQLPSVMWASNYKKLKFQLKNGMAVIAKGNIDVYEQSGKYQFYVDSIEPEGVGALRLAFEQMVKRLEAAGLFEQIHKKPLPSYPFRIGIVTSEAGAALHDISSSIVKRWPPARLFLYPVSVQGEGAAESIASAIRTINRQNKKWQLELLIVGRGGGSLEDLWAFNEEIVARAIYDSKIPVISAVGHEIDTSISDLVADARAATPTKAAEIGVPDINEVAARIDTVEKRLHADIKAKVSFSHQSLKTILASAIFRSPLKIISHSMQQLDETADALQNAIKVIFAEIREKLRSCFEKIVQIEPHRLIGRKMVSLNELQNRCRQALNANISQQFIYSCECADAA